MYGKCNSGEVTFLGVDLQALVDELRAGGGDTSSVEVKAAAGGLPSTVDRSLSALANLPGGGSSCWAWTNVPAFAQCRSTLRR